MAINRLLIVGAVLILLACCCTFPVLPKKVDFPPLIERTVVVSPPRPKATQPPVVDEATPSAPSATSTKVFRKAGLYSLEYPSDWIVARTGGWQDFCESEAKEWCFHVQTEDGYTDLQKFKQDTFDVFKASVNDYSEISNRQTTISGVPAMVIEGSYTFHDFPKRGFAALLVHSKVGFYIQAEVVGQAPPEKYSKMQQTLRDILQSLKVLN